MPDGVPAPLTSFVGRRREIATLRRLLASTRCVTLAGPGGCGKTRLAMELARTARNTSVAWVDLAPFRRDTDVEQQVAQALRIGPAEQFDVALVQRSRDTAMLLVLDNCEHLLDGSADIAARLLRDDVRIRVLATSRAPLDIEGELLWRVPSLSTPAPLEADDPVRSLRSDAVRLFVERARFARPDFVLDPETCAHVGALCRALDGIPLAIELAAARLRHMTVAELAARLDDLPALLIGTRRSGDARHRTLGAALDWSHTLLDEDERAVLRRVSVFVSGFDLAGAEAVSDESGVQRSRVLARLTDLVDRSIIVPPDAAGRYRLLEPIRQYAHDRLRASGEEDATTGRCAAYLVDLVLRELPDPMGMGDDFAVRRAAQVLPDLLAIMTWLMRERPADAVKVLGRFAQDHMALTPIHVSTVSDWLERALSAYTTRDAVRVEGLLGQVQLLSQREAEHGAARRLADEALSITAELGDGALEARARARSAFIAMWTDPARAEREYDAAVPVLRRVHLGALALALSGRAILRQRAGEAPGAERDVAEALDAWDRHAGAANTLRINTLAAAAEIAFQAGDLRRADDRLREALGVLSGVNDPSALSFVVVVVEFLGHLAAVRGDDDRALRLSGAADRLREETGVWPRSWFSLTDRGWLGDVEARVGPAARSIRAEGGKLSTRQAMEYALGERPGPLSARELAVAGLVAEGFTDKEIAARLGISTRTAESHVQGVREKLGLRTRAQIGRWTATQGATRR